MLFGRRWDAFVSYKSGNVEVARPLAERLLASNLRVWFAEHQVLLVERERFQRAIDRGIAASRFGIALTNDAYAGSEYCEREMAQLLRRCGPERILEIRIPAHPDVRRKFPALARSRSMDYTGDLEGVLRFLAAHTGWRLAPPVASPNPGAEDGGPWRGECVGLPFTVDARGWTLVDPGAGEMGPSWRRQFGGTTLLWNLQFGREIEPTVYDARRPGRRADERAFYDRMCDYARGYFDRLRPAQVGGVHLLLLDGASHFAVSYRDGPFWFRRYSIMLVDPGSYRAAEFVLTFRVEGPFTRLCEASAVIDAAARSVRWGASVAGDGARAAPQGPDAPSVEADRLRRVIADQPAANKLFDQGMALLKAGRLEEGIAELDRLLAYSVMREMQGAALFNIGRAYEKLRDPERAARSYEASVAAFPGQFNALSNLGTLHYRRGDVRAALDCYERALALRPDDFVTVNNAVICYRELGDTARADEWLAKLQRLKR